MNTSTIAKQRKSLNSKDQTRLRIEKMEAEREERRRAMQERKRERAQEEQRLIAAGNPGDVDFIGMVRKWRENHKHEVNTHDGNKETKGAGQPKICICVRKRPISDKERKKNDHDSITCLNPLVWIHSAKFRVDGITKYLDHNSFKFDHAFHESVSTEDVYRHTTMPLLDFICAGTGGRATVFAYGQTGSGKTYTMNGIQNILVEDLFLLLSNDTQQIPGFENWCTLQDTNVTVSFFELYGGFVQDLLNDRKRLKLLEDGKGEVNINGLEEFDANTPEQFLYLVEAGNNARTTQRTEANDTSSRSHAICQICLRDKKTNKLKGKLSLVDLAGSERGTDTKSHNAQRRAESADINTSLLSLKECIRALGQNKNGATHVPYRGSKLTLILKDCFTSKNAMTTMIATISPGASSADHTINTLRYANRIKEQRVDEKIVTSRVSAMKPLRQQQQKSTSIKTASRSNSACSEQFSQPKNSRGNANTSAVLNVSSSILVDDDDDDDDSLLLLQDEDADLDASGFLIEDHHRHHQHHHNHISPTATTITTTTSASIASPPSSPQINHNINNINTRKKIKSNAIGVGHTISNDDYDDDEEEEKIEELLNTDSEDIELLLTSTRSSLEKQQQHREEEELFDEDEKEEEEEEGVEVEDELVYYNHTTETFSQDDSDDGSGESSVKGGNSGSIATNIKSINHNNSHGASPSSTTTADQEAELRAIVKAMFEQEEIILNLHMANIQENAELLTEEGKMLQEVQRDGVSKEDIDLYVLTLSEILDRKEYLIALLQEKIGTFRSHLKKEQDLSKKVKRVGHF